MTFRWRWPLILFALVLSGGPLSAASTREQRAYGVAVLDFQHEKWSRAETEFGQFVGKYKESTNAPMALLLEAQAQFKQGKFTNAIALLADARHQAKAGTLADQYAYWIGEAQFQIGDFSNAAETWIALAQKFPESQSRLRAVVEAAAAFGQMTNWSRVDDLLGDTNGVFQRAAQLYPGNELVLDGQLSLENSKCQQRDFPGAVVVYERLTDQRKALNQIQQCQGTHLFYQAEVGLGDFDAALAATTNLVRIAGSPTNQEWLATAWASQGAALEQLGRTNEAIAAYRENLTTNAPVMRRREAIFEIAELEIVRGGLTNAGEALTNFLAQFPEAISADIALLTAGELRLKDYTTQPEATNQLAAAQECFDQFLRVFTSSPLTGNAYLDRGWCGWLAAKYFENSGDTKTAAQKYSESLADFEAAAQSANLPPEYLAVALFKTGDTMFALTNYAGALTNYRAVLDDFTNFPAVAATLGDRALYQILRANLQLTNYDGASNALAQILKQYPASSLAPGGALLYGEGLSDARQPAAAREQLQQFAAQFPDTPLRPELEFAIARTHELEQDWPAAIAGYQGWLDHFPTNQLRPQAVYALALANSEAGNETDAFGLFTNFVAQFPANDLAPLAQWWVAGHFFGLGGANSVNYVDAERNYKLIYQNPNFPTNELVYPARMMAGLAAMGHQGYNGAIRDYFKILEGDTNCPIDLRVQATFAHGDALMQMDSTVTNDPLHNFSEATNVLSQICQKYPTNELGARAWGKIGECEFQLAHYDAATDAFARVLSANVQANISLRSQAQIIIGIVLEKKAALATGTNKTALFQSALANYLDVFYGSNRRDDETADPSWVKKAGLAAARLEESLQEWSPALHYYRDLTNAWPS
ncbi:MAG: tetratricopeptide repeat protein, partial [Verrucomicrobiota bacterium]